MTSQHVITEYHGMSEHSMLPDGFPEWSRRRCLKTRFPKASRLGGWPRLVVPQEVFENQASEGFLLERQAQTGPAGGI